MKKIVLPIITVLAGSASCAYATVTLGEVAQHALVPAIMMVQMGYAACYVVGTALMIGSLIRYKDYRTNPMHVRMTQPMLLFMFGAFLILLPIVSQYSSSSPAAANLYSMELQQ